MQNYGPYEDDDIENMYSNDEENLDENNKEDITEEDSEEETEDSENNKSFDKDVGNYDETVEEDLNNESDEGQGNAYGGKISTIGLILVVIILIPVVITVNLYSIFSLTVNNFLASSIGIQGSQVSPSAYYSIFSINTSRLPPNSSVYYTNNVNGSPQEATIINNSCSSASDCKSFNYSYFFKLYAINNNYNYTKYSIYKNNYDDAQIFFNIIILFIMALLLFNSYTNLEKRTAKNTYIFIFLYISIGFGVLGVGGFVLIYTLYGILANKNLISNGL